MLLRRAKTIDSEEFSDSIAVSGDFSFSLNVPSAFSGTVHLQRSTDRKAKGSDAAATWLNTTDNDGNVKSWTGGPLTAKISEATKEDVYYRFGCDSGNYTSGAIDGEITQ